MVRTMDIGVGTENYSVETEIWDCLVKAGTRYRPNMVRTSNCFDKASPNHLEKADTSNNLKYPDGMSMEPGYGILRWLKFGVHSTLIEYKFL